MNELSRKIPLLLVLYCLSIDVPAADTYFSPRGIAIRGFDTVAYFEQDAAVKGNPDISFEWMGTTWLFSSTDNRDKFAQSPRDYAPQYGGYCAYAMAGGQRAESDARAWTIIGGKLYLNYSKDVRSLWKKKAKRRYIRDANRQWKKISP